MALSPAARRLLSTTGKVAFGSRPNSGFQSPYSNSGGTPRRQPSDLGVIRRPSSTLSNKAPPTPRSHSDESAPPANPGTLTNDLLNLSGSKSSLTSPQSKKS